MSVIPWIKASRPRTPPLALDARTVLACRAPLELYPELQRLSLATLLFAVVSGLGAAL